jgi:hypothetical protein
MTQQTVALPLSVLARAPRPELSARYKYISTMDIVRAVEEEGYKIHSARAVGANRSVEPLYTRHIVEMRAPSEHDGLSARVSIINSHDGSSRTRVSVGLYRLVCSNGMVAAVSGSETAARHSGPNAAAAIIDRARSLARNTAPLFRKMEEWSRIDLSRSERFAYARMVAQLRWGDAERFAPEALLEVRREGDDAGDLWSTFNRLQEATVRGGVVGLSRSGRRSTSRPISDFVRDDEYNAALWRLTEELAEVL